MIQNIPSITTPPPPSLKKSTQKHTLLYYINCVQWSWKNQDSHQQVNYAPPHCDLHKRVSSAGAAISIISVTTKLLLRQTRTRLLSWQKYVCHDRSLIATKILFYFCHNKTFEKVTTKVLLQQAYFCRNKSKLVATKLLSWQNCLLGQICRDKSFVTTKICLSQQKFCHDKHTSVATKDLFCHTKLSTQYFFKLWQLPPIITGNL